MMRAGCSVGGDQCAEAGGHDGGGHPAQVPCLCIQIECKAILNNISLSYGGIAAWEELKAQKLVAMMEAAIQRMSPGMYII